MDKVTLTSILIQLCFYMYFCVSPKRLLIIIFSQESEKHSKELLKNVPEYNFFKLWK